MAYCMNCGAAEPGRRAAFAWECVGTSRCRSSRRRLRHVLLDALETQLLLDRAKVKSPGFAAVLGFFFPWLGALYNGKILAAIAFGFVDIIFIGLSFIAIGIPELLMFGFLGAYLSFKWATETNRSALEKLVASQRQPRL